MKPKYTLFIGAFLLLATYRSFGQLPDSIKNHIDSSLSILKTNSLYAKKVDWQKIEKRVYDTAQFAKSKAETFGALKIAFDVLNDKHAAYYQYDDQYKIENTALNARYSDSIKAAWSRGPRIIHQMIGKFAYLNIPFMAAGKQEDIDKYANWIYEAVLNLHQQNPDGWIIDLRLNGGGNIRPMLAGLAPFFNDGIVSYYIDREGRATDEASFKQGNFMIDGVKQATIKTKSPYFEETKVAVLIGPGTASSGEGVAAVFHGRKNTRLVGENSAGLANATNGFVFNSNESYFLISTAYIGSKDKKPLPEFIKPDISVKGNDCFSDPAKDTVVGAAVKWLQE